MFQIRFFFSASNLAEFNHEVFGHIICESRARVIQLQNFMCALAFLFSLNLINPWACVYLRLWMLFCQKVESILTCLSRCVPTTCIFCCKHACYTHGTCFIRNLFQYMCSLNGEVVYCVTLVAGANFSRVCQHAFVRMHAVYVFSCMCDCWSLSVCYFVDILQVCMREYAPLLAIPMSTESAHACCVCPHCKKL